MNTQTGSWEFNPAVANMFVDHARQHIPNYDLVIDKSVDICSQLSRSASIIDVGCATGETIRRLHAAGFNNLTGVESSQAMLQHCDYNLAKYQHSDQFPMETFDAVICNWTLHFIKNKIDYLRNIYHNMANSGVLVLSEKTSLDPVSIHFYHAWKHSNGVSWEDIRSKEAAIKGIMYINDPDWYIDTLLHMGFKNIQIIDASWCFTTFMCKKQ